MQYVWIAVLALAVSIEALTAEYVAIWFFPAALVSMILAFCKVPLPIQLLVFLFVGLVLVLCTRRLCKRLAKGRVRTNTDALIGTTALVTEEISNVQEQGEVKVGGLRWSARAAKKEQIIPVGTEVTVLAIEGVKLIVE